MEEVLSLSSEHKLNLQEIDEQHQRFLDISNELLKLGREPQINREKVQQTIGKFGDYAFFHFGTEEKYFADLNYSDAESHIAAHDAYRQEVKKYMNMLSDESQDIKQIVEEMAAFSSRWLLSHIIAMDKKYVDLFRENGVG